MDIRTKLVLAFVAVALSSMLLLGVFALDATTGIVKRISARQLEALAESKQRDLEKVVNGWHDRVHLISSRTQLRRSMNDLSSGLSSAEHQRLTRILSDALASVADLKRLTLFDVEGRTVVSVGESRIPHSVEVPVPRDVELAEVLSFENDVEVMFYAPLELDGKRVGVLEVVQGVDEVEDVTGDYTGMEESGEAFVVMRTDDGGALFLNRLRHGSGDLSRIAKDQIGEDIEAALTGVERVFSGGVRDYRGELVWAATRFVSATGWGLVVKVDAAEEGKKTLELRDVMLDLALSLSAFAVLGGTLLGLALARPIRRLADVMERIRAGERGLRADEAAHDEVGFVGRALNELMDELRGGGPPPPSSND